MSLIDRRKLLKVSGAGVLATRSGGIAAILAAGRAPAYAQGTAIHWLRWGDFVPASDRLLRTEITAECQKALGIKLSIEMINANDIQSRITSAIQSGQGPDIIYAFNNWPQLYADSLADVGDIAEEIGKAQGGYYQASRDVATVGNKWIAVPWAIGGRRIVYRRSWFEEVGYNKFPETWEEYLAAGKKLKAKGHPLGQTLGHTFGDAPGFWYPYSWSWGGKEVESDGKTVMLNSKETVESVKFAVGLWKDAHDEGGLAWDDSSNNRAFLSGTISATDNGASIYLEAKLKPDTYSTEKGTPMRDDILHAPIPKGLGGRFTLPVTSSNMLMRYSKNLNPAKDFIRWISSKQIFEKWFASQQGYSDGATLDWENDPVWNVDPIMLPFKDVARTGRLPGYAGPPGRAAAEALTKYIIVDMYAKAVQGMSPETSVKLAHQELVKIYA
jgi:ABC-type glycerol-3-phosphate transport system substrate-binding protein